MRTTRNYGYCIKQLISCKDYLQEKGLNDSCVDVFCDFDTTNICGTELYSLIKGIQNGIYERVIVEKVSRLSKDTVVWHSFNKECQKYHVEIFFVNEPQNIFS